MKTMLRWLLAHRKSTLAFLLVLPTLGVNALAWVHARAMTHFVAEGEKTRNPEQLSRIEKLGVLLRGVALPRPTNRSNPEQVGLKYQTLVFASTDGTELEAWHISHPKPQGITLLFHGYTASKVSQLEEAKAFHDLGQSVLLVDFRGSGGSGGNTTTIGVKEADDVLAAFHYAGEHWPDLPVTLFGQSMGSAAILRALALHAIQPHGLVLECPFDRLLTTVSHRFGAMGLPAFPGAHLLVFWGGVQHNFNGFQHNPVDYAKEVRCPVLLMHGINDPRVAKSEVEGIFENLQGKKTLEWGTGVGHESFLAANPGTWRTAVERFMSSTLGK